MRSEFRHFKIGFILSLFAFTLINIPANADSLDGVQDFTKTIKKEFPINPNGIIALSNRYGRIEVKTWDRDRVKIDVTIVVKARSESDAQEVFNRIGVDFTNSDSYVKAETTIESSRTNWWNWRISTKSEFQINYEVFMPGSCGLDLSNKYGNSTVAEIRGKANVSVKYGDILMKGVGGNLNIMLGYGNGTIVKTNDVSADISYSRITFNAAKDVLLSSKYSKVNIENADDIRTESSYDQLNFLKARKVNVSSRYGNITLGTVENMSVSAKYTDYKIEELAGSGDFDLQYGGLSLTKLVRGFSSLNLVGKYSDFKIGVDPGASYTLDAVSSYAGITYPTGLKVSYEKDKNTSKEVKGTFGGSGSRGIIKASVNYGGLKIR